MLTDEGIGYSSKEFDYNFKDMLLFDKTLKVRMGKHETGTRFGIEIHTTTRRLKLCLNSSYEMFDWVEAFIDSISRNPYCKRNRFTSFSPQRSKNFAKWYINGEHYYDDVANCIEEAKSEIYITDWWLSPEVYLKRPVKIDAEGKKDTYWRLDHVLKRAADRKVNIRILLYKEFEQALYNSSAHAKAYLSDMCGENLKVIRHPSNRIFMWSHHEKMVTIDQRICFMGGLDLCYGRWDRSDYPLVDPGDDVNEVYFPGQDYTNVRLKDFEDVPNFDRTLIDKNSQPRMPWRDIAVQLRGLVTKDLSRHFI